MPDYCDSQPISRNVFRLNTGRASALVHYTDKAVLFCAASNGCEVGQIANTAARLGVCLTYIVTERPTSEIVSALRQLFPEALLVGEHPHAHEHLDIIFQDRLQLRVNEELLDFKQWGPTNARSSLTLRLHQENILFASDLISPTTEQHTTACAPIAWVRALRELEQIPSIRICPAVGPALLDAEAVRRLRICIEQMIAAVETAKRTERSLESIAPSVAAIDPCFDWSQHSGLEPWPDRRQMIIERVWRAMNFHG